MTHAVRAITDADQAAAAFRAVSGEVASVEHLARVLIRDDVHLVVAYRSDVPIGFTYGYELPRMKRDESTLLLYEIDVIAGFRTQGVGRALLDAFLDVARDRGCPSVWLVTNASNAAAMALYRSAGGRRTHQDDVMMRFRV